MTKQVQLRRGTTTEHAAFTGAVGELTIDTDKDVAVVHDGVKVGGHELVGVAATSQSIVNKDGVGIGTTNARSPLTVIGDSFISGVSTFTSGVGAGNTVVYVEGDARVTGTLSIGSSTIVLNGDTNTISVENIAVNRINITGYGVTIFSLDTNTRGNISSGSSIITIRDITNVNVGDFISIPSYLESTIITGIGTGISDTSFEQEILSTIVSEEVGSGSSIIALNSISGISTGNLISIDSLLITVPIIGFTTVLLSNLVDEVITTTIISSPTLTSDTIIAIGSSFNISIGNSFSVNGSVAPIPIIGITTTTIDEYQSLVLFTTVSEDVGIGTDIIPVNNTTGISTGNIANIVVGSGVSISDTVTGFTTNTITIGSATTIGISSESFVNVFEIRTDSAAVELGAPVGVALSVGTIAQITESVFPVRDAVIISTEDTISEIIPVDSVVSISEVTTTSSAVIIGNTISQTAPDNSAVEIKRIEEVENNLQIDALNTGTINVTGIATIATVDINAGEIDVARIGTQNITVSGISTLSGFVDINNSADVSGNLSVTGISTLSGFVDINNSVDIGVDLNVVGVTTLNDYVDINDSVGISSDLNVVGLTTLSGYVDINDSLGIGNNLTVTNDVVIGGNVDIDDYVDINADLNVVGLTTLGGYVDINDSVGISSDLNVVGLTTLSGLTYPTIDGLDGQVIRTDGQGNLSIGPVTGGGGDFAIIVSASDGDDTNDGVNLPVQTIKRAAQLASFIGDPATIFVESGDYIEENPIILYDDISIIGDSLRNVVIRPAQAGKDLFRVRNGCYLTNMTFNDFVDGLTKVPQHTWNYSIAFDDPYDTTTDRTGYACTGTKDVVGATFDPNTGLAEITTATPHQLYRGTTARILGIGWTCGYDESGISTVRYTAASGITTVTTFSDRGYSIGTKVFLHNLPFSIIGGGTTIFPDDNSEYGRVITVTGVNTAAKTFTFLSGISTVLNAFEGWPEVGISTFVYTNSTGISTATTTTPHGFEVNDRVTLADLTFAGITTTVFPDPTGTSLTATPDGFTFTVTGVTTNTFTFNAGISTIAHNYVSDGYAKKVPTVQKVVFYPDQNPDGKIDFGVVAKVGITTFVVRTSIPTNIPHFYTLGGTINLTKPKINKSPYIQNCSILSALGGNGIIVDGDKIVDSNRGLIPELGEQPVEGPQPEFGKSMVANAFTMISFGGIGWRTINDAYAQVVSCFQIFCKYGSLCQSGGYLSITNSATNFGSFALRSTGFSRKSFDFDRGRVVATGTQDGLQTLRVIGLGRSDQQLYVLRFLNNAGVDETSLFKPLVQTQEITGDAIDTQTNIITVGGHPFQNLDSVIYSGVENQNPPQIPSGILNEGVYYVQYIDASQFRLFFDEGLQTVVSLGSTFVGINTISRNNQEFYVDDIIDSHQVYQQISFASTTITPQFVSGREVIQTVIGGNAVGFAVTYNATQNKLIVSTESVGGIRNLFNASGGAILDHSPSPVAIGVTAVVGINTLTTINFKLDSTVSGNVLVGISSLVENYRCHFHRPSIVNSSAHTWEYSGAGTDYNALPQNGGKGIAESEQVSEGGGRVFASGTNELGDFKIGSQITAFNRTGNIIFNNKVSIGELDSIRLSLSGGVSVEEFSTSVQLGEDEVGGPRNKRVPTQLAVRSFLGNRLGTFIDKAVSSNAVPNAVVQLNSNGQINGDLIPPRVVSFVQTPVGTGRTVLVNRIPAINIAQGDTIVEPDDSYVLINDTVSQYLILDNGNTNFVFANDDEIISALSDSTVGVVTAPPQGIGIGTTVAPYVGYGTTGLVKGVALNLTLSAAGSGYLTPGVYNGIPADAITGIGTGALINVTVGAGGNVTSVSLLTGGKGYAVGNIISVNNVSLIGGRTGGSNFQATISQNETRLYLKLTNNQKFAGSSALPDFIQDGSSVAISTSLTTEYFEDFNPTDVLTAGDVDFSSGKLVLGSNQFADGDPIIYDTLGNDILAAAGAGIINLDTYYIKIVGAGTSVELHRNYQLNNKVVFTGSGNGTHRLRRPVVNIQKNTVVFVNHPYEPGTPVRASADTPTGISTGQFLYCGSVTENSFTFHLTQFDALSSVNGVTFNPIAIGGTHTGTFTLTEQNVRYQKTVNTSSTDPNNWSLVAAGTVDAANIVSGIIASSRLGSGTANSDTVLNGTSEYVKAVFSVGIGTTQPMSATSQNTVFPPGGVGVTTHFGNVNITLNRVQASNLDTFSTLGVARFKTSTFTVGEDGAISIKTSATGDVDASTLGGVSGSFYLDTVNHIGSVPISRGGTGQTGAPAVGAILIGNGSAYNLTNTPTFAGGVTFNSGIAVTGIATATRFTSNVATGTAPLTVTSTTQVNNLNANFLGGTTRAALDFAISEAKTLAYFNGVS
jgi:hypothetical protein